MTDQQILQINIISALGLQNAPADEKIKLISNMSSLVMNRLIVRVLGVLSEEDQKELDVLLGEKGNGNPEVGVFLKNKIPNIDELFDQEVVTVKRDMIDAMGPVISAA